MRKICFPKIGARIIKSGTAVLFCFLIHQMSCRNGILFYMALAALQCMQPDLTGSKSIAKQRICGTFIGALYGLLTILLQYGFLLPLQFPYVCYCAIVTLCVMASLYTAVVLKLQSAAYFSCVVYLSITMVHIGDENPCLFIANRVVDTLLGVGIGMLVNRFQLPRRKQKDTLFVAGLDDVLLSQDSHLSDFSRIELNRMLEEGLSFTIMTIRTPASFWEAAQGIRLKLPVILMDGAVIYDPLQNSYPYKCEMSYLQASEIVLSLQSMGLESFQNVVDNDNVFIYFQQINNSGAAQIYEKLRRSPYRNYIRRPLPDGEPVAYIMAVDLTEKIETAYQTLAAAENAAQYKFLCYSSQDYPGYAYLKIYHKDANKTKALEYLKSMTGFQKTCTFGTVPDMYDELVERLPADDVIRLLKKRYEPLIWQQHV
ncbi:MAG: HAD hydrolase family protein [Muribaculum sp.]|nr:HAD hydrolase family protein [Muribaculum sp.]